MTPRLRAPILRAFKTPERLADYRRIFKQVMQKTIEKSSSVSYEFAADPESFARKYITLSMLNILFGALTEEEEDLTLQAGSTDPSRLQVLIRDLFIRAKASATPTPIMKEMIADGFTEKEMLITLAVLLLGANANPPLALKELFYYLENEALAGALAEELATAGDETPNMVIHMVQEVLKCSESFLSIRRIVGANLILVQTDPENPSEKKFLRLLKGAQIALDTKGEAKGTRFDPAKVIASASMHADKKSQPSTLPFSKGIHMCPAQWLAMEMLCSAVEVLAKGGRFSHPARPEGALSGEAGIPEKIFSAHLEDYAELFFDSEDSEG